MKLRKNICLNTELGFIVSEILSFVSRFDFVSFTDVKRSGNRVAHTIAHLQAYDLSRWVWLGDGPDRVLDLVTEDIRNSFGD